MGTLTQTPAAPTIEGKTGLRKSPRVMLFTDTLGDVNGVSRFIRNAAQQAHETGRNLFVVTSTRFATPDLPNVRNFKPLWARPMPGYPQLDVVLPPALAMIAFALEFRPDVIHLSTPGSVGTAGLIASMLLRVPVAGVYHTDFPAYVDHIFHDDSLTYFTQASMGLFYKRFSRVLSRSEEYREGILRIGVSPDKLGTLLAGIRTQEFSPRFANREAMAALCNSSASTIRVLYAGRVSVEKNLEMLTRIWLAADPVLREKGINAQLVVIGDGPYKTRMERELSQTRAAFLGFRHAEELSMCYASSDIFAFPSTTDTLGQVVMESQSSGLPVLVTDQGGPSQVVEEGRTGFVLGGNKGDEGAWVERIVALASDAAKRREMGAAAHQSMQKYSMAKSFDHFWEVHEELAAAVRR